jgi:hypothetical protein
MIVKDPPGLVETATPSVSLLTLAVVAARAVNVL